MSSWFSFQSKGWFAAVLAALFTALILSAGLAACSRPDTTPWKLTDVSGHLPDLDFKLTDDTGKPVTGQSFLGQTTLVYFGYTHCPDVCPTTMATIASALRELPAAQASQVQVVFVSTDPTRDTPAVLKAWLGQYNPAFIGLTGSFAVIQKAAASLGIDIEAPVKQADGSYTVTHGAEVIAFDTQGKGYLVYTAGTTVDQFTHDIPLILAGRDG